MSQGRKFHFTTAGASGNLRAGSSDRRRAEQPGGRASDVAKEASMEVEMKIHDLLKNVLLGLEVRVQKVVVNDLKDDTFYALIWVERDGQMMTIDSRPSDALALALRMDCPIFVEDEVLKNSKISSAITERSTNEQLRSWLEGLSDDDLGRYKM